MFTLLPDAGNTDAGPLMTQHPRQHNAVPIFQQPAQLIVVRKYKADSAVPPQPGGREARSQSGFGGFTVLISRQRINGPRQLKAIRERREVIGE